MLILISLVIIFLLGYSLKKSFKEVIECKCFYCKKKIGKFYLDGKSRFREKANDKLIWSHTKCIPKSKLNTWRITQ